MDIQKNRIRNIVGGIYDIQKLRIATGNRIVASLRPGLVEDVKEGEEDPKYLPAILSEYRRITDYFVPSLRGVEALKRPSPLTIRSTSRAALTMIW